VGQLQIDVPAEPTMLSLAERSLSARVRGRFVLQCRQPEAPTLDAPAIMGSVHPSVPVDRSGDLRTSLLEILYMRCSRAGPNAAMPVPVPRPCRISCSTDRGRAPGSAGVYLLLGLRSRFLSFAPLVGMARYRGGLSSAVAARRAGRVSFRLASIRG
jgi:hypothetical protein